MKSTHFNIYTRSGNNSRINSRIDSRIILVPAFVLFTLQIILPPSSNNTQWLEMKQRRVHVSTFVTRSGDNSRISSHPTLHLTLAPIALPPRPQTYNPL